MKTTNIVPMLLLALFAISFAIAAVNGAGGIKRLLKRQPINRKTFVTTLVALTLAIGTLVPTVAMWPSAVVDEPLTNAEGNHGINPDDPDVPMSGDRTNAQLDEFLRAGFGEDYEAVWNGSTIDEFMLKNDQDKILANEAYLKSLGLEKTGFRNGVCFPTQVLTAEVIKNLDSMTDEERADVFNQHRWIDVYWRIMTNPGYCDMWVQDLEEYPEYTEQNDRWLPALKELLAEAKASPDGAYSLLVQDTDGTEHLSDAYRYGAARVCASLENAVIRGVAMDPQSVMNWELPSLSPEIQDRWTVKLTEEKDQENLPASIWAFPNVKSGNDAYTEGADLADLRAEKFAPENTVAKIDNPDPGTPRSHTVWTYHRILGTETNIVQPTPQTVAEGKDWRTEKKTFNDYNYHSNNYGTSNGVVTGTMGNGDVYVIFYYTVKQRTEQPTYLNLTVKHVNIDDNFSLIEQEGPASYVKGTSGLTASKKDLTAKGYEYAGYYSVNNGGYVYGDSTTITLNSDTTVVFYYRKIVANQTVTAYYRATDSNRNLILPVQQTKKVGESYTTEQKDFSPLYRFAYVTGDPTSGTVLDRPMEVVYWYEPVIADGNNNKNTESDPTKTGNANPVKGPDDTTDLDRWQPNDPDTGERVPPQQGNEPTSNHLPTDNPGGQAAGSENRQEVGNNTESGIVPDNKDTTSSGTGGQDPGHVDTGTNEGVKEVEGGGYTPPAKDPIVPDTPPSSNDPVVPAGQVLAEP